MHSNETAQDHNPTPYGVNFDQANLFDQWILIISGFSLLISLVSTILDQKLSPFWFQLLFLLQLIIALLVVVLRIGQDNELDEAYNKKRKCEIDTAFDTKLSSQVVKNYFDIGPLTLGYKRLLAITHENALFTSKNSSEYKKIFGAITGIFILLVIVSFAFGFQLSNYSLSLLSFVLSALFLERLLSSHKLSKECISLANECAQIIESWNEKNSFAKVIDVYAAYGNLLSSTKVNINPRIHQKFVDENNAEWSKVFTRYYSEN